MAVVPRHALVASLPDGQDVHDLLRLGRLAQVRIRKVTPVREDLESVFHRLLAEPAEGEAP